VDLGTFIAAALLLAAAVGWILTGRLKTYEAQLLHLSRGDRERTNHLIEQEQRRTKGLSREAAAKRALDQIRRDTD